MRALCVLILASSLCACAAPRASVKSAFIEDTDRLAVTKAREGLAYFARGKVADAEFSLRQSLYLKPNSVTVRYNLATVLKTSQQYDEAQGILTELIARYPEELEYREALARLLFERGDILESRRHFSNVLDAAVLKGDATRASRLGRTLAQLSFRVGDERTALCASEEAVSWDRSEEQVSEHMKLLLAANRPATAMKFFETLPDAGIIAVEAQASAYELGLSEKAREIRKNQISRSAQDEAQKSFADFIRLLVAEPGMVAATDLSAAAQDALAASPKARILWPVKIYRQALLLK